VPYVSDSQRRKFHAMANRGQISESTVDEWDRATKGKKLPEKKGGTATWAKRRASSK
jgi:hypothetical protein